MFVFKWDYPQKAENFLGYWKDFTVKKVINTSGMKQEKDNDRTVMSKQHFKWNYRGNMRRNN